MDYFQSLEKLRREVFSEEPAKKIIKSTGFVPQRQSMPEEDSRNLASRPQEWLKQIKAASEGLKTSKPSGGFASGLATVLGDSLDKKVDAKKEAALKEEEGKEKLITRRGERPSSYAPDKSFVPVSFDNDWEAVAQAVKDVESSGGDYSIRGPVVTKGTYKGERAMGAYQVMPGNLAQWSKAALGREVTEEEFMGSPEIQDAVFIDQMKKSKEKHGSVEDAVSVWFSGRPLDKAGNASDGYITAPEYVSKFQRQYKTYSKVVKT